MKVLALALALHDKVLALALVLREKSWPKGQDFAPQDSGHVVAVGYRYVYALLTLIMSHDSLSFLV